MLETILKKREENPEEELEEKTITKRVIEVAKPIFFSTIIIITAYLPLFAFERVEKKLFTPMAFTVGYALWCIAVALLLIPGLAYVIYRKPQKLYHNKWLEKISCLRKKLKKLCRLLKVILPVSIVLATAGILSYTVGKDFLPELDEGSIWLQVQLPPGISLAKAKEMSDTLRARTLKHSEITYMMVQAGRK
jgi:cobalt-zinc-cadmium resistance protein CzcA